MGCLCLAETVAIKKSTLLGIGIIVALVIGFAIGFFANPFLSGEKNVLPEGPGFVLTDLDKNFLVTLANSQVVLTAQKTALQSDWCLANGGEWDASQQAGELQVTKEQADSLSSQGFNVYQAVDGNWIAKVIVFNRTGCILPEKKQ